MKRKLLIGGALASAWTITLALIAADYAWWRGFNDGADTQLCAMSVIVEGNAESMRHDYCQRLKGRTPPIDVFRMKHP